MPHIAMLMILQKVPRCGSKSGWLQKFNQFLILVLVHWQNFREDSVFSLRECANRRTFRQTDRQTNKKQTPDKTYFLGGAFPTLIANLSKHFLIHVSYWVANKIQRTAVLISTCLILQTTVGYHCSDVVAYWKRGRTFKKSS